MKKKFIIIIVIISIAVVAFLCSLPFIYNWKPKVDTEHLNLLLSKSSELTAAKLKITGISDFKDTGIVFINRSDFIMVYTATIRAGINMDDVKIESNNIDKIYITIPEAQVQEAKVDPTTIKFFDEKLALFNVNEKEDLAQAITLAEEKAKEEAVNTGILELANQQSATLIKGILANAIPKGYEIEVKE